MEQGQGRSSTCLGTAKVSVSSVPVSFSSGTPTPFWRKLLVSNLLKPKLEKETNCSWDPGNFTTTVPHPVADADVFACQHQHQHLMTTQEYKAVDNSHLNHRRSPGWRPLSWRGEGVRLNPFHHHHNYHLNHNGASSWSSPWSLCSSCVTSRSGINHSWTQTRSDQVVSYISLTIYL